MSRAEAVALLQAVGSEEAKRLLRTVKRGPSVVDEVTTKRIEKLVQAAYVRAEYGP